MRGSTARQTTMFAVADPGDLLPTQHPIRRIRRFVDSALERLEPAFEAMYAKVGRPSIPPEQLLKASVLMALYSIRSERQFCEQLQYNLLFKWFLGMNLEDVAFDATSFTKNRDRLLEHEVAKLALPGRAGGSRNPAADLQPALHGRRDAVGVVGLAQEPGAEAEPGWTAGAEAEPARRT